jgi:hypothetical protein
MMMKHSFAIILLLTGLSGCARSSALPLAADMVQITTSAAPVCGQAGAMRVAAKMAAVETLKHGFDKFVILGSQAQNNVGVIGHSPATAYTTYGNGYATTHFQGGTPIVGGSHDHGLIVKMFRDSDPLGANAISAKSTLGPKWQEVMESHSVTCLD